MLNYQGKDAARKGGNAKGMLQVHPYPIVQLYGFAFALLAVLALASLIGTVVSCIVHCAAKQNAAKAREGDGEDVIGRAGAEAGGLELQPLGSVPAKEKPRRASLHLEDADAIEAARSVEEALAALTPRLIESDAFTRAATVEEIATALAELRSKKEETVKEDEEEAEEGGDGSERPPPAAAAAAAAADAPLLGATEAMHLELTALVQKLRETLKPAWQWRICTPRCLFPPDISREEAALATRRAKGGGASHTPLIKPTFSQLLRALAEEAEVAVDTLVPFAPPPAWRTLSEVWRWRGDDDGGGGGAAALDAAEAGFAEEEAAVGTETWLLGRRVNTREGEERRRERCGSSSSSLSGRKAVTSRLVIQSNPIHRPDRGNKLYTDASAHV